VARIAEALERLAAEAPALPDFVASTPMVWHPDGRLAPVGASTASRCRCSRAIDRRAHLLMENTERFAKGLPANKRLLWRAPAWANPRW